MPRGNNDMYTDDVQINHFLHLNREMSPPSRIYCDKENPYLNEYLAGRVAIGDLSVHFNKRNTSFYYRGRTAFAQYIGMFFDKHAYVTYIRTLSAAFAIEVNYDYIPYKGSFVMCTYAVIFWNTERFVGTTDALVFQGFLPRIYSIKCPRAVQEIICALRKGNPEKSIPSCPDNKHPQSDLKVRRTMVVQRNTPQSPPRNPIRDEEKDETARHTASVLDNTNEPKEPNNYSTPDLTNFNEPCDYVSLQVDVTAAPIHENEEAAPEAAAKIRPLVYIARPNSMIERDPVFRAMNNMCPDLLQTIDILFPMDDDNKKAFCNEIVITGYAKLGTGLTPGELRALKMILMKTYDVPEIAVLKEFRRFFEPDRFNA